MIDLDALERQAHTLDPACPARALIAEVRRLRRKLTMPGIVERATRMADAPFDETAEERAGIEPIPDDDRATAELRARLEAAGQFCDDVNAGRCERGVNALALAREASAKLAARKPDEDP